jgi:hypothetical protein
MSHRRPSADQWRHLLATTCVFAVCGLCVLCQVYPEAVPLLGGVAFTRMGPWLSDLLRL